MKKREFQALLDDGGSSLMKTAVDLGLAKSTVSRWRTNVPRYAQWYAVARALMTPEQLTEIDSRFRRRAS